MKFSEADFANHENDGSLVVTVTISVTGNTPGTNPLELSFEALTESQYDARANAPETPLECTALAPQNNDEGGGEFACLQGTFDGS